ncbi:5155_t:CDS:2 [Ambispora gerdemannii]|uniref:5155_t:CDS:1 n=1 Tax=Ambispora gerdemannii TaxID=144530 RepID=A0A9N8VU82_9GLOM|nr:5155_t:CDS:2 [Ambispora gerdemannii]
MTSPLKFFLRKVQVINVKLLACRAGVGKQKLVANVKCHKSYLTGIPVCLASSELPPFLQDPKIATLTLRVTKKNMPALIIQWNDGGFNDVPTVPFCRNGVPGQTKLALIAILVANGAVNHSNTVFTFPNGQALSTCEQAIPAWARHQAGVPDVAFSVQRLTTYTLKDQIDIEACPFIFNQNR